MIRSFSITLTIISMVFMAATSELSATEPQAAGVYWIFLTDKGPDIEERILEFQKTLPERTILRRQKATENEIVADAYDLPVYSVYRDSLNQYVKTFREESRWLNAMSAIIIEDNLKVIEHLSFVEKIRPVAKSDPQSLNYEIAESWQAGDFNFEASPASLDYGQSFRQVEQINAIRAHEQGYHGEGVIICFLDTGFLTYHHAFDHMNILAAYDFINDDDFVGFDQDQDLPGQPNHGTGCLGTIGGYYPGELIGPAFAASYILCKTEETGSETAVEEDYYVAGLEWGERLGADVASSSLSYSDWYTTDDYDGQTCITTIAANIAFRKGMILCSSMGNSGPGKFTLGAPADSRYSLGIGGVQWNGLLYSHSSWGPTADGRIKPDVCARAVKTIAATPYTTDGFGKWNGTSLSCPLVAGAVALVIQARPQWSPEMVKEAVKETASQAHHPDIRFGWGIVNTMDAINYPSFSGYIVDNETKHGLPIEIKLESDKTGQTIAIQSDSSGFFLFANIPEGDYRVIIDDGDFEPYQASIAVPPSEEYDIYLGRKQ
ncbi:MAG: S8 family serine peptidase [candidate division Zixibacteria bacterium]|nr:S8 family serine peptidase [candidate division Zixibacteria bacterium]